MRADRQEVTHYTRGESYQLRLVKIVAEGTLALNSPGITVATGDFYAWKSVAESGEVGSRH
ncbi:MAG: hypothetical protein JO157_14210 [Acetobacteraceae bacterium]|nr:hypothetical protein [Acetobacteraceae bacterium]